MSKNLRSNIVARDTNLQQMVGGLQRKGSQHNKSKQTRDLEMSEAINPNDLTHQMGSVNTEN